MSIQTSKSKKGNIISKNRGTITIGVTYTLWEYQRKKKGKKEIFKAI